MQAGHTTRLRIGIASLVVLAMTVAVAAFAGTAKAGNGGQIAFDPQTINVPYLAWRGDEVRLVKCFSNAVVAGGTTGTFTIEDWSGLADFKPQFSTSIYPGGEAGDAATAEALAGFGEQVGRTCFGADLVSQKAGLAVVKLKVSTGGGSNRVLAEHQFLVAWMGIETTNVEDIGPLSVPASSAALDTVNEVEGDDSPVCDPITSGGELVGNCELEASRETTEASQNQVQVLVTGIIPMENNFDEVNAQMGRTAGTPLRMPADWDDLANIMARSNLPGWERGGILWDIHDEDTGVAAANGVYPVTPPAHGPELDDPSDAGPTHQDGGTCDGSSSTMDEVDNCLGISGVTGLGTFGEFGSFSRFVHPYAAGLLPDTTSFTLDALGNPVATTGNPTIGPYDPLRTDTYLPNGILDEGDAPMPTARIDFRLTGDGMLLPIDKHVVYSRNGSGQPTNVDPDPTVEGDEFIDYPDNAHNLWAPFYGRFIPATAAEDALGTPASGEDGGYPNNFHSYLVRGLYHYWDFAVAIERNGALVDCPPFAPGIPASEAFGIFEATVYTDEHGEARIGFNAGVGFGIFPAANENGACDLQAAGIDPGEQVGAATISAIARYPHQPVTVADVPGDEVVAKTITSLFAKTLTCVRKTNDLTQALWICTAVATGIDGTPFSNELVCFSTTGERILQFPDSDPPLLPPPGGSVGPAVACEYTDSDGVAEIEVIGKGQFNVVAEFVDENIFRRFDIAGSPLSGTTGGNPGTGAVGGTGGTPTTPPAPPASPPPAASTPPSLGGTGTVKPSAPRPSVQAKVVSARLVVTKTGRKLLLRVKSAKGTAKVRIVLRARNGKVLATAVRTVRANRVVTVPNLRIARGAARINVSVLS